MFLQCFTAMVRDDDGEDILTMGCIGQLERAELNCHVGSKSFVAIKCCNRGDYCNRNLVPRYTTDSISSDASNGKIRFIYCTQLEHEHQYFDRSIIFEAERRATFSHGPVDGRRRFFDIRVLVYNKLATSQSKKLV